MYNVLVVTGKNTDNGLSLVVEDNGITCFYKNYTELIAKGKSKLNAHVILLDMSSLDNGTAIEMSRHCREIQLPVMVIIPWEHFEHYDSQIRPDDFVIHPFRAGELLARINVLLKLTRERNGTKLLKAGDVQIDTEAYEVSVSGRKAILTYKEYQLLVLLASNPGRVYSREELLTQIWGYDYFGGTRTVDVHIRRLRSKLERGNNTFIETVWNVGYRLKVLDHKT